MGDWLVRDGISYNTINLEFISMPNNIRTYVKRPFAEVNPVVKTSKLFLNT